MKRIMVIQHIACEPLGRFEEVEDSEWKFDYLRPFAGDSIPSSLAGWDALIVLGGPMAVYEAGQFPFLARELELLRLAINEELPVLGICLGSQLIAAAAGTRVFAGDRRELGWDTVQLTEDAAHDPLFAGLPAELPVFQLHGDTFDMPAGAVRLAGSRIYENQAFRIGKNIYGLQFHVEVTGEIVRDWTSYYKEYITEGGTSGEAILSCLEEKIDEMRPAASRIIRGFLGLI